MRNKENVHRFLHRGKPRKAKALHVICRGSLPSIMKKRTCSLFNDDQLSSIINMLASSWIKRFFLSRKSEEVRLCWTRNHMSLPLIRVEKSWKGCHNRKQTERSHQIFIHIAGWWRSTFFALFYFSLPVISKISLCGRTFWHGTTAPTTRRLTTDKRSTKRAANNPASTSCKVTYWPIKTRARVLEGHFLALYYNFPHGKVPPFWTRASAVFRRQRLRAKTASFRTSHRRWNQQ